MAKTQRLSCTCGKTEIEVTGPHIASVECVCDSCRQAAKALETLPNAPKIADEKQATAYVMHRKDQIRFLAGQEHFKEYRLPSDTGTRRVVATCCSTPVFLEFKDGHWLSLYGQLWPDGQLPALEMRTMTGDLPSPNDLPDDVPNLKKHSLSFYGRLFGAWVRMGFRNPKIAAYDKLNT